MAGLGAEVTRSRLGPRGWLDGPGFDTEVPYATLLENAARQRRERGLDDYLVVDADFHQLEVGVWAEILEYVDNDVMRHYLETGGGGRLWIPASPTASGIQDVSGRILVQRKHNQESATNGGADREVDLIRQTMAALGTDYVLLFPTILLHLGVNPNVELEPHIARAHARWMTERVLSQDSRILTLLFLPFNDPDACLALVEEFGDRQGVVGFMVTSVRNRPVHDKRYMRLYRCLEERGLPLGFHSAFSFSERSLEQFNRFISLHSLGFPYYNMIQLTNWVINGLPERFPNLDLMFIESGLAWLPFLMERLDHEYRMRSSEAPLLKQLPSEYIRRFYYTSQPLESATNPSYLQTTFEMINAETQLLYASDWPHWDFDLPGRILDVPFLSGRARRRILGENAARLFKLAPKAVQAAPVRADAVGV